MEVLIILIVLIGFIVLFVKMMSKSSSQKRATKEQPPGKHFTFLVCDDTEDIPTNKWYRLKRWSRPNFLKMESEWTEDWKPFSIEEEVAGFTRGKRQDNFVLMGDQPDFRVFLRRERDNPVDPNAIKVMGSATVGGKRTTRQLGYLSKETAALLKDEEELDARPRITELPYEDRYSGLSITVLVRPQSYKKKMKKAQ